MDPVDPAGILRAQDLPADGVPAALKVSARVKLRPGLLRLSGDGVFYTLQGEGVTQGLPAVFVRLHVCNLRCEWCDAWYTWSPRSIAFWTESRECDPGTVARQVREAVPPDLRNEVKRVVITGGEPLLQVDAVDRLMEALPDWSVEIETNGTLMPSALQLSRAQFNCSPKLAHSGNSSASRIVPEVLTALNRADAWFKFVVRSTADLDELDRDFRPYLSAARILLMPEGVTVDALRENTRQIGDAACQRGYRVIGRLQVERWGATRGR